MLLVASTPNNAIEARSALQDRLQSRRNEIEQTVLTRVFAVADSVEAADPEYVEGIKAAVGAAIDYGFAAIRLGEHRSPAPPPVLLAQARLAARSSVSLDTVLRRYFAGYALVADFLVEEAERSSAFSGPELQGLLRSQAALLERIVAAVSEEHARESAIRLSTNQERRAERVDRLLAGELVDTTELSYDFEAHHVSVIACGMGAMELLRGLAGDLDRRLLAVRREGEVVWGWLGGNRAIGSSEVRRLASTVIGPGQALAIGEPAHGLVGWRHTHQQARAALAVVLRGSESLVRYADVALLAAVLKDQLLATSLTELYLTPLKTERNGGEVLRETMRAYFAARGNITSAATALGVKRQTVTNRIRAVEERLGRDLNTCAAEMEAALRLEELNCGRPAPSRYAKTHTLPERARVPVSEADG
jgi:PucR C-terminal helix-turn-helix domain/GGDEF-like domain